MEFNQFKRLVQRSLDCIIHSESHLYYTEVSKDELWDTYLNSFPVEIRQEFNCNYCKQFIKCYGNVVVINSHYEVITYWDLEVDNLVWQWVANNLKRLVLSKPIAGVFIPTQPKLGTDYNLETPAIRWEHFYYQLPSRFTGRIRDVDVELKKREYRDNKNVFKRSLEELTLSSVTTVLELIAENNLYRGEQFKQLLTQFQKHLVYYGVVDNKLRDNYCWYWATKGAPHRVRNTSIGTLLVDLSNEVDLDVAVRKFEAVVAPTNYRRPKAIVSARMIEEAQKTIEELGLTSALNRRFANIDDINVNDLLWATDLIIGSPIISDVPYNTTLE